MLIASLFTRKAYFYLFSLKISFFSLLIASSLDLALRFIELSDFFDSVNYFSISLTWVEYISLALECLSELRNCSIFPSWTNLSNLGMKDAIVELLINYFWEPEPCSELDLRILFLMEDWLKERLRVLKSWSVIYLASREDKL